MKLPCRMPPRHRLGFFPTPLIELPRLSRKLGGPRLLMKRDDQAGLAMGGNKVRKLEFLLGGALAEGCDTLITGGAAQSNHCRQTAAAAAACGLDCHLVLGGHEPETPQGNLLLDRLLGAQLHWTGEFRKGEKIPEIAGELQRSGRKPYVVPYGGSNAVGAFGFVEAVRELAAQVDESGQTVTHIVIASSSGGTQAGLVVGKRIFRQNFRIIGIGIDKGEAGAGPFREHVRLLAGATAREAGVDDAFGSEEVIIRDEYTGGGYGVVGELERKAIEAAAREEGILLDPVYTGRAMGALMDLIRRGEFAKDDCVLFWHTGGTPALFAYAGEFVG